MWSRRPSLLILALVLLPIGAQPVFGQSMARDVEVRAMTTDLEPTSPGGIVTLSFRTINHSAQRREFQESVELPANWRLLVPPRSFELAPSEDHLSVVAVSLPGSAEAGTQPLSYRVYARDDHAVAASAVVSVQVVAVERMRLVVDHQPSVLMAGAEEQAALRLTNEGNTSRVVRLNVRHADDSLSLDVSPEAAELAPGESALVAVTIGAAKNARAGRRVFHVHAVEDIEERSVASAGVSFEIVRTDMATDVRGHCLPVNLALMFIGDDDSSGFQARLEGAGPLVAGGTAYVDLHAVGPDRSNIGIFGERSRWHAGYSDDELTFRVGDQAVRLSPLTDPSHYGRGISAQGSVSEDLRLGAHLLTGSRLWRHGDTLGLWAAYDVSTSTELRLNHLQSAGSDRGNRSVTSLECTHQIGRSWRLSGELGTPLSAGSAWRLDATGRLGPDSYLSASTRQASSDHEGYYSGLGTSSLSLSTRLDEKTVARFGLRTHDRKPDPESRSSAAEKERLRQLSVSRRFAPSWSIGLTLEDYRVRDALLPMDVSYDQTSWGLSLDRRMRDASVRAQLRAINRHNRLTDQTSSSGQLGLYGSWRPDSSRTLSAFATVEDRRSTPGGRLLAGRDNLGASMAWRFTDRLDAEFAYQRYGGLISEWRSDQLSSRVNYVMPDGREAFASIRRRQHSSGDARTAWAIGVSIPLNVPLEFPSTGMIHGRVVDAQDEDGRGCPGVIVRLNGIAAVSDEEGSFSLRGIPTGTHYLTADNSSFPVGWITAVPMPMQLEIEDRSAETVTIELTRAGRTSGRLTPRQPHADDPGDAVVGAPRRADVGPNLSNVLVTAIRGDEVLRSLTDQEGRFDFVHIRPGDWTIRVDTRDLPPYHELREPEVEVTVAPGGLEALTFDVSPITRRIRMIDGGAVGVDSYRDGDREGAADEDAL